MQDWKVLWHALPLYFGFTSEVHGGQLMYLVSHPLAAAYGQASQAQPGLADEGCAVPDALNIVQLQGAHVCPLPEPLAVELQRPDPAQIEVTQLAQACQVPNTAAASSQVLDKQCTAWLGLKLWAWSSGY